LDASGSIDMEVDVNSAINDRIFITGLPLTMPKQYLSNALRDVFSTVGDIKVIERKIL
jgi:hypothetical protein